MLDLDIASVEGWLRETLPNAAHAIKPTIQPDETPRVLVSMIRIGHQLAHVQRKDPDAFSARLKDPETASAFQEVLAHAGLPRRMRILHWLTEVDVPDRHEVLAGLLGGGDTGDMLRSSLIYLHRNALLREIFSEERIEVVMRACRTFAGGPA